MPVTEIPPSLFITVTTMLFRRAFAVVAHCFAFVDDEDNILFAAHAWCGLSGDVQAPAGEHHGRESANSVDL